MFLMKNVRGSEGLTSRKHLLHLAYEKWSGIALTVRPIQAEIAEKIVDGQPRQHSAWDCEAPEVRLEQWMGGQGTPDFSRAMKELVVHVEEAADVLPGEAAAHGPFPVDEGQRAIGEPLHIPG